MSLTTAPLHRLRVHVLSALGVLCVVLGAIGIVVPGLPTTVFLLLAAYFFARSSPTLHSRLVESRILGAYLRAARDRRMPTRAKVMSLLAMWSGVTVSLFRLPGDRVLLMGSLMVVAALVGSVVILRLRGNCPISPLSSRGPESGSGLQVIRRESELSSELISEGRLS